MKQHQPQHGAQLSAHPCNNTAVMPPFASTSSGMSSAPYPDCFSTLPASSLSLPSSIFLPPPTHPSSTFAGQHNAQMLPLPLSMPQQHQPPHSMSSFALPASQPPHASPPSLDYPASFSLSLHSPHHPALVKLTATSFLPLRSWLPWLEWDGSWVESHPMQTVARCPIGMVSDTVRILHEKGLKQTRHMLLAKF